MYKIYLNPELKKSFWVLLYENHNVENGKEKLVDLYTETFSEIPKKIAAFPSSGSNRKYFRLFGRTENAIGVMGEDPYENKAFIGFTKHFSEAGLSVPKIYATKLDEGIYLQEDLGDESLFNILAKHDSDVLPERIDHLYKKVIEALVNFQITGDKGLDYSLCYPIDKFNEDAMQWDLNYFKYYFLKPSNISFDEHKLEQDFSSLIRYLSQANLHYFMYRDFQARNILIKDNKPFFIDYQGGRKGPLQYDLASLLFQAKANLTPDFREAMLDHYLRTLSENIQFNAHVFTEHYYGFVLLRTLQVLGAYGYRGYFEQKPHFIESAQFAIKNLNWFLENITLPVQLPELFKNLRLLIEGNEKLQNPNGLTVEINSFSYLKYGIPKDVSGHGGGFVFDCRALPNPGRYPEYRTVTGKDQEVIDFLQKEKAVDEFLLNVKNITTQAIEKYLERGFDHLTISFGCTGGQHRSVYSAEWLYKFLRENYTANFILRHRMME